MNESLQQSYSSLSHLNNEWRGTEDCLTRTRSSDRQEIIHAYGITRFITVFSILLQRDQKVSFHLTNNPHTIDELKMTITLYIRNVDRAILNAVFFQV